MPKRALPLKSPSITLDRTSKTPLSRQIYLGLRNAILEGVYLSHERVPSTRMLAATVGVSRNTVQTAYDQLSAKGYVCGKVGSGTRVAKPIPDTYLRELLRPSPAIQNHLPPDIKAIVLSGSPGTPSRQRREFVLLLRFELSHVLDWRSITMAAQPSAAPALGNSSGPIQCWLESLVLAIWSPLAIWGVSTFVSFSANIQWRCRPRIHINRIASWQRRFWTRAFLHGDI